MSNFTSPVDLSRVDVANAAQRPRPVRFVITVIVAALILLLIYAAATNSRLAWGTVAQYLVAPSVLAGLAMTLFLTIVVQIIGLLLGMVIAVGQLSDFLPVRSICRVYVGLFRGVPPLVQLIFWFNLAYLVPRIGVGIPFGPTFFSWSANDLITPLTAAVIGLSLHESAYSAEIIRSGIISVDPGQRDAAKAMGFSGTQTFWKVIMPQAMRVIVPTAGSEFISLLKGTSLVSVITLTDLLYSVQIIYSRTYQVVPLLIVAVIWYLIVVTVLTFVQRRVERRFGRGFSRAAIATKRVRAIETKAEVAE